MALRKKTTADLVAAKVSADETHASTINALREQALAREADIDQRLAELEAEQRVLGGLLAEVTV